MSQLTITEPSLEKDAKKASIVSIPVGYFIASEIAFIASVFIAIKYDIGWDEQFDRGTWLVLGGFSLWIPTSALILPIMIVIRYYAVVHLKRLTVSSGGGTDEPIKFTEKLYFFKKTKTVEIKQADINFIKIKRETWEIKYIWIVLLSFHLIYMLTDGLTLLTNPFIFGDGIDNALTYTFAGVLDIIIIVFLIFTPQTLIEVHTDEEIYKFVYFAREHNQKIFDKLEEILGILPTDTENRWEPLNFTQKKKAPRMELIIGIIFILIAVISKIFQIFAGGPLRLILYFSGIIFIFYACNYELPLSKHAKFIQLNRNQTNGWINYRNSTVFSRSGYLVKNKDSKQSYPELQLIELDAVRFAPIIFLPLITGWTLGAWFRFLPESPVSTIFPIVSILNILLSLAMLVMLLLFATRVYETYLPADNWGDEKIQLPHIYCNTHKEFEGANILGKIKFMKSNLNDGMKKQLIIRLSLILGLSVIGIACAFIF